MRYLIVMTFLMLAGCAATTSVDITMPPSAGIFDVESIAVGDFKGSHGSEFATGLARTLEGLDTYNIVASDAEATIDGRANVKKRSSRFYVSETSCDDQNNCNTDTLRCTRTWYEMKVNINLESLYSKDFARSIRSESCPADPSYDDEYNIGFPSRKVKLASQTAEREVAESSDPVERMQDSILLEIAEDLGEYTLSVDVKFASDDESLSDADQKLFKDAVNLAKRDDIRSACAIWADLERTNLQAPYLLYNLGVCSETTGDKASAMTYYSKAALLMGKQDRLITQGLERLRLGE